MSDLNEKTGKKALSGRPVEELDIQAVMNGEFEEDDFRISPDTLTAQAQAAEQAGYKPLGRNFRRAAELVRVPHREVIEIYNQLRPGRTDYATLMSLAQRLVSEYNAPLTADLVREAAEAYLKRGVIPKD